MNTRARRNRQGNTHGSVMSALQDDAISNVVVQRAPLNVSGVAGTVEFRDLSESGSVPLVIIYKLSDQKFDSSQVSHTKALKYCPVCWRAAMLVTPAAVLGVPLPADSH